MADGADILDGTERALRTPARINLSDWADRNYYLSPESSAVPGRWKCLPYQRGILDAITDPRVERVTWIKSARIGATKAMNVAIAYHMDQDPCPIMVVQPTVEDAQGYSKDEIATMLRDVDCLRDLVTSSARTSEATILFKSFPGGSLSLVGANSARGFRRVSRRIVIFDEVDGYPPSAGAEGDQIALGIRRTDYYWDRKIIAASTPLNAGTSRIEPMFLDGDQRRYHVPCPHCDSGDILVFREGDRGHFMTWSHGKPESAYYVCSENGCVIREVSKRAMVEHGGWIADAVFDRHASFHLWAAYSMSPNTTWAQIATEFLKAAPSPLTLKTFVNTVLGETWQERGEAPDYDRLYQRREHYQIGSVPEGVHFLTAGVDVQQDRVVYEVVGWGLDKQSWSLDAGVLMGDTALESSWARLDELLGRTYYGASADYAIAMLAIDSGYQTQQVYSWARSHPMSRVIAVKGVATARTLIGTPSAVDITSRGRRMQRGYKVWPVAVGIAKGEFYSWLRLPGAKDGEDPAPGYCHFPEYDEEYFRQITAEHLVQTHKRGGHTSYEWQVLPGRQNHFLDARVYARAAAAVQGLDRVKAPARPAAQASAPAAPRQQAAAPAHRRKPRRKSKGSNWLSNWADRR